MFQWKVHVQYTDFIYVHNWMNEIKLNVHVYVRGGGERWVGDGSFPKSTSRFLILWGSKTSEE